jgi:hypothetical protein
MNPFGVLAASVSHFARGLPLALALAVFSTATTVGLFLAGSFLDPEGGGRALWPLAVLAWIVFTHIWLALFLTGWRLRRETPGFRYGAAAGRAAAWAAGGTALIALAVWSLILWPEEPASFAADRLPPRWHPVWLGIMAGWAAMCAFGLPARVMLGRRDRTLGVGEAVAILVAVAAWLVVIDFLSLPARTCQGECWGFMEGGMVMVPLLGLWLFLMTAGAAALSAAAWSRTVRG